jgi:cytochrome P450
MVFLTVGHETTSFALVSCTDILATHPHIQNKVYEQIIQLSGPIID